MTKHDASKKDFFAAGHTIPECVNIGCNTDVRVVNWATWTFGTECGTCATYRRKGEDRKGIVRHKKDHCENHDGHLGFTCPVPRDKWDVHRSSLQLDHKDGNHWNNNPENVETLCPLCHDKKGEQNGDFNSHKKSARKL